MFFKGMCLLVGAIVLFASFTDSAVPKEKVVLVESPQEAAAIKVVDDFKVSCFIRFRRLWGRGYG